jgi:hypothetical protein
VSSIDIIEDFCIKYKSITEKIFLAAEKEDFDKITELLEGRQQLMNNLSIESYNKSSFASALKKTSIIEMEEKLNNLLNEKKKSFAEGIINIEKNKKANEVYNMAYLNGNKSILSKRV